MSRRLASALWFVALAGAGFLGGCANDGLATSDVAPVSHRAPQPQDALASLPDKAGTVVGISEKHYENGIEQTLVLAGDAATPGENTLLVGVRKRRPENYGADRMLELKKPEQRDIAQELRQRFPGIAMRISGRIGRNPYGHFGYASGTGKTGAQCFYAWQWIDGRTGQGSLFGLDRLRQSQDLSLRVRLCRKDLSEDRFVATLEALRLRDSLVRAGS